MIRVHLVSFVVHISEPSACGSLQSRTPKRPEKPTRFRINYLTSPNESNLRQTLRTPLYDTPGRHCCLPQDSLAPELWVARCGGYMPCLCSLLHACLPDIAGGSDIVYDNVCFARRWGQDGIEFGQTPIGCAPLCLFVVVFVFMRVYVCINRA